MSGLSPSVMIRTVFSPLFIGLVALVVGQAILLCRWRHLAWLERWACLLLAVSTGMLLTASLPIVASLLLYSLERQYEEPSAIDLTRANAVVVLSRGYARGKDPSKDRLDGTAPRVFCGVDGFKGSGAKWLIMSGAPPRSGELMRDLAIERGVPPERILIESSSRNTFEHPLEVRKLAQARGADTVVVVTDAFHIPRAMGEFKRYFPRAIPIPCEVHGPPSAGPRQFLPHVGALGRSTAMLQEYLGVVWYGIRHLGD